MPGPRPAARAVPPGYVLIVATTWPPAVPWCTLKVAPGTVTLLPWGSVFVTRGSPVAAWLGLGAGVGVWPGVADGMGLGRGEGLGRGGAAARASADRATALNPTANVRCRRGITLYPSLWLTGSSSTARV